MANFNALDYKAAYSSFEKAYYAGNSEAEYMLGYMKFYGYGGNQNVVAAKEHWKNAAQDGNELARKALATVSGSHEMSHGESPWNAPAILSIVLGVLGLIVGFMNKSRITTISNDFRRSHQDNRTFNISRKDDDTPTTKQLSYAASIAMRKNVIIPAEVKRSKSKMKIWINKNK